MKNNKLIIILSICILLSCAQNQRYRALSFFLDGVPNPEEKNDQTNNVVLITSSEDSLNARVSNTTETENQRFYHPDYQKKLCKKCHDEGNAFAIIKQQPLLCYDCHEDLSAKHKLLHGPVASGFCSACHEPHLSKVEHLLKYSKQELCLYCHSFEDINKSQAHDGIEETNCLRCHDAHGGETNAYLVKAINESENKTDNSVQE